jgi:dihydrofolate reductase/thymidylate synthase
MTNFFDIIVAYDENRGIGKDGKLPWNIPEDLVNFRKITTKTINPCNQNMIIMGRNTFNSIGRVLPHRLNVVVSSKKEDFDRKQVKVVSSLSQALKFGFNDNSIDRIFVIGGEQLYKEAILNPYLRDIYVTEIQGNYECDRFFPRFGPGYFQPYLFEPCRFSDDVVYRFMTYRRNEYIDNYNEREEQYRNLVHNIINNGISTTFRNGRGQYLFNAATLRYDLREGFPLTTLRSLPFKSIFSELSWMLSGSTNVRDLQNRGCRIWDANSSRGFLDASGKSHLEEFDVGPTYGFQWRHFGAKYVNCHTDYSGQGFDQLSNLIENIIKDPNSRRHIVTLWNPPDVDIAALPPCMYEFVFNVENGIYLNMDVRIRSSDVAVGLPWNIASSALLLTMISAVTKKIPRNLNITLDNAHIYEENMEKLLMVIMRTPKRYGRLNVKRIPDNITDFEFKDFELVDYHPESGVNFKMVA